MVVPSIEEWYPKGEFADTVVYKFRKGACENCGALTHKTKECVERPRKVKAKYSGKDFGKDELVKEVSLDWEGKRDVWNGFKPEMFVQRLRENEEQEEARVRKQLEDAKAKGIDPSDLDIDAEFKDKVYESTGQVSVGNKDPKIKTHAKNLRLREDRPKYLMNLDEKSAYYDGKSRSMRENPNPHLPAEKQVFKGDNYLRFTGDTVRLLRQEEFAWRHIEKEGTQINSITYPTATELLYKKYLDKHESKMTKRDEVLKNNYEGESQKEALEKAGLLFETEAYREFDEEGKEIEMEEKAADESKYNEDLYLKNHSSVWGSWWNATLGWGFACCHSNDKHSVCEEERGKKRAIVREYKMKKAIEAEQQAMADYEARMRDPAFHKEQMVAEKMAEIERLLGSSKGKKKKEKEEEGSKGDSKSKENEENEENERSRSRSRSQGKRKREGDSAEKN